jgi:hypothetical protein
MLQLEGPESSFIVLMEGKKDILALKSSNNSYLIRSVDQEINGTDLPQNIFICT